MKAFNNHHILARRAREAAKQRGHSMKPFKFTHCVGDYAGYPLKQLRNAKPGEVATVGVSDCRNCYAYVTISTHPAPNSIDISGSAVAVGCGEGGYAFLTQSDGTS